MATNEVMTGEELAATPKENRYYVCQDCGTRGTDATQFRFITFAYIAFVICRGCLGK